MSHVKRLGMGLEALIGNTETEAAPSGTIETVLIRPNPYQPRADFDESEIKSMAESIRRQGVLQPVVVRPVNGVYELVAGERRWRAAKEAGLDRIPASIREVDDRKMLELALVENLQRKDLNAMEKARAFKQLMQFNGWTQEELADAVGLGRPTAANFLRLLDLPVEAQEAVSRGPISMGHARALLAVPQRGALLSLLKRVIQEDLSVRALEKLVTARKPAARAAAPASKDPYTMELEQKLMDKLGVRVAIEPGKIVISYASNEELTAVLGRLGAL